MTLMSEERVLLNSGGGFSADVAFPSAGGSSGDLVWPWTHDAFHEIAPSNTWSTKAIDSRAPRPDRCPTHLGHHNGVTGQQDDVSRLAFPY